MCLPQAIKSFQNYRGVATTFYPTLVCGRDFTVGETIQHWFKQFKESGHVEMHKSPG